MRDQRFQSLGQNGPGICHVHIRSSQGDEHILFVVKLLAGRAIGDPILLVLVQMQKSLENGNEDAQTGSNEREARDVRG